MELLNTQQILSIPLSIRQIPDCQVWFDTKNGSYTVKSGYKFLGSTLDNVTNTSSSVQGNWLWKKLWHCAVPRKTMLFMWKVIHDILPTRSELIKRGVNIELMCPLCEIEVETAFHCLCNCQFSRLVWLTTKCGYRDISNFHDSIIDWLQGVFEVLNKDETEEFICLLWAIWKTRNVVVFNQSRSTPMVVVEIGLDLIHQFRRAFRAHGNSKDDGYENTSEVWGRLNSAKLNTDAALFHSGGECKLGAGFIVRNQNADVILAEIDCKEVVHWVKNRRSTGQLGHIVEDCLLLLERIYCQRGQQSSSFLAQHAKTLMSGEVFWTNVADMPNNIFLFKQKPYLTGSFKT
ncbi:Reverse transcriptase zinc-binding domain - like 4 [Theobroma cacao]|nr:Reverse transcriptase zinc-binding domain - like 4 [Theobroma cacao]